MRGRRIREVISHPHHIPLPPLPCPSLPPLLHQKFGAPCEREDSRKEGPLCSCFFAGRTLGTGAKWPLRASARRSHAALHSINAHTSLSGGRYYSPHDSKKNERGRRKRRRALHALHPQGIVRHESQGERAQSDRAPLRGRSRHGRLPGRLREEGAGKLCQQDRSLLRQWTGEQKSAPRAIGVSATSNATANDAAARNARRNRVKMIRASTRSCSDYGRRLRRTETFR